MDPALRRTAIWVTLIQFLLNLNWALYVAFLPALLVAAGLDARYAIVLLMVDQATFAASDWAAGVYADRLARVLGRIGPAVTLFALVSSAALLLLPWLAKLGSPALLIAATLVWTVTSSALRAPVFTLLGRVAGSARPPGAISLALAGVGVAGAIAPLVTASLAAVDPRLPLGVGAATLAIAALLCSRLERTLPGPGATAANAVHPPASDEQASRAQAASTARTGAQAAKAARTGAQAIVAARTESPARAAPRAGAHAAGAVALIVLLAALGTQLHTVSLAAPLKASGVAWIAWWGPTFWTGFALGMLVAAWLGRAKHAAATGSMAAPARLGLGALLIGAAAMVLAPLATAFEAFVLEQAIAGAGWAVFMSVAVRAALDRASGSGAGGPLGMIFSALAIAALARLALTASGWQATLASGWMAAASWLLAAMALVAFAKRVPARASG